MDKAILRGYICVTDVKSRPIGYQNGEGTYYHEIIKSQVFRDALEKASPSLMFNHKRVLAYGPDLQLKEDGIGLHYQASITDIEIIAKALDNELTGCSFAFKAISHHAENQKGEHVRIIDKMYLYDVSILDIKPSHKSSVEIVEIPQSLRIKAEEYRKSKLGKSDASAYQKRIDLLKVQAPKKEQDLTGYEDRLKKLKG